MTFFLILIISPYLFLLLKKGGAYNQDFTVIIFGSKYICSKLITKSCLYNITLDNIYFHCYFLKQIFFPFAGTQRINIKLASLALVAGAVIQRLNTCTKGQCSLCIQQLLQAKQSSPLYNLIEFQDRGNLIYPNMKFVQVLSIIQDFVAASVPELISRCNISVILCRVLVKKLSDFNIFECPTDFSHFPVIWEYICKYFVSIILKNFASTTTEVQMKRKAFYHKPLSRKFFKLSQCFI